MSQTLGQALKALRRARGLSIRALARSANCSPSMVGHVETGTRTATREMAAAWDRALGTTPLLVAKHDADNPEGSAMRRRVVIGQLASVAGLGAMAGPGEVSATIRDGLLAAIEGDAVEDWSSIVTRRSTEIINAPAPDLELRLLADLALTIEAIRNGNRDAARAASHLALLQGQCQADRGDAKSASEWYQAATTLADRSGDGRLAVYVRGRRAVRMVYETGSIPRVTNIAASGLALSSRPSLGSVECHVAVANSYARVGNKLAMKHMRAAVDMALSLSSSADPIAQEAGFNSTRRALHHRTYVLSRIGTLAETESAYEEVEAEGMSAVWLAQARLYLAYRLVMDGDVTEGLSLATRAVDAISPQHRTRILGQLIGELLASIPDVGRYQNGAHALFSLAKGGRS